MIHSFNTFLESTSGSKVFVLMGEADLGEKDDLLGVFSSRNDAVNSAKSYHDKMKKDINMTQYSNFTLFPCSIGDFNSNRHWDNKYHEILNLNSAR